MGNGFQLLTKEEAKTAMQLGEELDQGKRRLPPEILAKKAEIAKETRRAELFMAVLGVVDYGMVNRVVRLRLELDALYAEWTRSETSSVSA